jgi:hypothetical protein
MSKFNKLIDKARNSSQNITFIELCYLFEKCEFVNRGQEGSHVLYKYSGTPAVSYPIQSGASGKAKVYQVDWLIDWFDENNKKEIIKKK